MTPRPHLSVGLSLALAAAQGCGRPAPPPAPRAHVPPDATADGRMPTRSPGLRLGDTRFRHAVVGRALAFAPDGRVVFSGGTDGCVRAWDVVSGALARVYPGHGGAVRAVALAPDGRTLAAGDADGHVHLWRVAITRVVHNWLMVGVLEAKACGWKPHTRERSQVERCLSQAERRLMQAVKALAFLRRCHPAGLAARLPAAAAMTLSSTGPTTQPPALPASAR